jgi:hypothetical protein
LGIGNFKVDWAEQRTDLLDLFYRDFGSCASGLVLGDVRRDYDQYGERGLFGYILRDAVQVLFPDSGVLSAADLLYWNESADNLLWA